MSATAAVAFAAAANCVRTAISHIRATGAHPDDGPMGTVVTDLERIVGLPAGELLASAGLARLEVLYLQDTNIGEPLRRALRDRFGEGVCRFE
jgi:hypothetical protein